MKIKYPSETIENKKKILYNKKFKTGYDVVLSNNDVIKFIDTLPNKSATLIVTSPPYNIGKPYENKLPLDEYLKWQKQVIKKCKSKLADEGSICWEIGNFIEKKTVKGKYQKGTISEVTPLDTKFFDIFKSLGFKCRNRIVWRFGHGLHAKNRFSGRYETILWFTKTDDYKFNLDPVRVPQKYPGKRAFKGKNKGKPSGNPLGKNPSDTWKIIIKDWEEEWWDVPNCKSNHPEKTLHDCQFPIELIERLVLALTDEKDIVFDPFMGVGSALVAGLLHNRKVAGVDKEKQYTDVAYDRIIKAANGRLQKRPLGKPIHKPNGNEKVSKIPEEWKKQKKLN